MDVKTVFLNIELDRKLILNNVLVLKSKKISTKSIV